MTNRDVDRIVPQLVLNRIEGKILNATFTKDENPISLSILNESDERAVLLNDPFEYKIRFRISRDNRSWPISTSLTDRAALSRENIALKDNLVLCPCILFGCVTFGYNGRRRFLDDVDEFFSSCSSNSAILVSERDLYTLAGR